MVGNSINVRPRSASTRGAVASRVMSALALLVDPTLSKRKNCHPASATACSSALLKTVAPQDVWFHFCEIESCIVRLLEAHAVEA